MHSKNISWEFNVDKANQVLDAAGWKRGAGRCARQGRQAAQDGLPDLDQCRRARRPRQIVKQAAAKAGIELELKSVVASVFFGSDAANPDTYPHFYAGSSDVHDDQTQPDPQHLMNQFISWEVATKANKWQGRNVTRWRNDEYDRLYKSAETEMDPVKRAAMFIRMNDLVIQNVVVIPVIWRAKVSALSNKLKDTDISAWDSDLANLAFWHREA